MKGTIFDVIPSEGQEGFFQEAEEAPMPKSKSLLGKIGSFGKSALKGSAEGLYQLGRIMGPTGVDTREEFTESLDELLPTPNASFPERALRRGLKEAPTVLASPGSKLATLPRAIIGGFLGEGAKDLGLPEWAQSAAELTAYIGPDIIKKLLASGKDKEIIAAAREFGLSDEQITPLIQSEFKQKWLSKLAPKRGSTQKTLASSKEALSQAYNTLKGSESGKKAVGEVGERLLQKKLDSTLFEMPSQVRSKIAKDVSDLFVRPVTGESLMNFYSDVSSSIGSNSKQLSLLKPIIKEAANSISPKFGKEFELVTDLYRRYSNIAQKLGPTLTSDIIGAAETLGIVGSITFGNYPALVGILGEQLAKKVAQQMLLNPNFQMLGKKMGVAINTNKFNLARKVMQDYIKQVKKTSPEAAKKLEDVGEEQLEEFFSSLPSTEKQSRP